MLKHDSLCGPYTRGWLLPPAARGEGWAGFRAGNGGSRSKMRRQRVFCLNCVVWGHMILLFIHSFKVAETLKISTFNVK